MVYDWEISFFESSTDCVFSFTSLALSPTMIGVCDWLAKLCCFWMIWSLREFNWLTKTLFSFNCVEKSVHKTASAFYYCYISAWGVAFLLEPSPLLEDTSYGVFSLGNPLELDPADSWYYYLLMGSLFGLGLTEGDVIDLIDKFRASIFDWYFI